MLLMEPLELCFLHVSELMLESHEISDYLLPCFCSFS